MKKLYSFYTLCLLLLLCVSLFCVQAFAVEDMWTAANRIIVDVYSKIAGISTVPVSYTHLDVYKRQGTYECTAYFHNLDPETGDIIGTAGAIITITIKN